jgi:predicted nucleic acid-binding protein
VIKLQDHGIDDDVIHDFISSLMLLSDPVEIEHFHFRYYPKDTADIAFILCAINGNASHLITYDQDLLELQPFWLLPNCINSGGRSSYFSNGSSNISALSHFMAPAITR